MAQRVEELAEAQKRTEQRVEELAEAQKRTEQRLEQLAAAQLKTEAELQRVSRRLDRVATQVGGLSDHLGYGLENAAYDVLPDILKTRYNVEVEKLYRTNVVYSLEKDKYDEVNIFGEGFRNGQKLYVVGECKARFGVKNFRDMENMLKRVQKKLDAPIFPLVLAHQYHPRVEILLKEHNIPYIWSYELKQPSTDGFSSN